MLRRGLPEAAVLIAATLTGVGFGAGVVRADEDPRNALEFVQALREHGYFELASDYLEKLRDDRGMPEDVRVVVDYEIGRLLIDESSRTADLVRRKELLEQARVRLEAFTKAHPDHDQTDEALVQLARLLVERGHLAVLFGEDSEDKAEKAAKLVEARGSFDEARAAYAKADERLKAEIKTFPNFLPDDDPRKPRRERMRVAMMDAELQMAIVDYEQGQTYPAGSKERADYLAKGLTQFEDLYKKYRVQIAGRVARMWQAKCYEEKGEIGPALGIYNELLEDTDPRLRGLQRNVAYFKIIAHGKRKEYPLAADEAVRWLQKYSNSEEKRSREGLGVQFELAKDIAAQLPQITKAADRETATRRVADVLGEVVRYSSPFKSEAIALLRQYKPKAALNATNIANLNYEDAVSQADQAIASHEWDRAIALWKQAVRRADPAKDADKANFARYHLAFCHYMNKQYYEADVLCEHLARRYPRGGLSGKATEIGMASLADAYNNYREIDRQSDLARLIELATYAAETWSDSEQGDNARMVLGQIYNGTGRYPEAIAAYEAVRTGSSKWIEAQTKVGDSHWRQNKVLRDKKTPEADKEADAEVKKALDRLDAALKARRDAGATPADPGLIENACDIAEIHLEGGKADEALKLLDPIARANQPNPSTAYARLMSDQLRAHVAVNKVDLALADMSALEKSGAGGGGGGLTQLYFSLGKLLEKEMDRLKAKHDSAGLSQTKQAYQKFLNALATSTSGQTYESLQWAGENMLALGNAKEAEGVFNRVLEKFGKDQKSERLFRTRLKRVAALREQGNFPEAEKLLDEVLKENPRALEPLQEKGLLLEARAGAAKGKANSQELWKGAFNHWRTLALKLGGKQPKPPEYYDAWYHTAYALFNDGKPTEAKKTLSSVMRLSASVGGPEIKAKYTALLQQIK